VDDLFTMANAGKMENPGRLLHGIIVFNNMTGTLIRWLTFVYHAQDILKIFDYFEEIYNEAGSNTIHNVNNTYIYVGSS